MTTFTPVSPDEQVQVDGGAGLSSRTSGDFRGTTITDPGEKAPSDTIRAVASAILAAAAG